MTKAAAIYNFWNSFDIPAYEENNVPTDAPYPYITYQFISDKFDYDVAMTASIYYRSSSDVQINAKAEEIGTFIDNIPKPQKIDGGRMMIKRGNPFSTPMGDENDNLVKRRILNIVVEYMTAH